MNAATDQLQPTAQVSRERQQRSYIATARIERAGVTVSFAITFDLTRFEEQYQAVHGGIWTARNSEVATTAEQRTHWRVDVTEIAYSDGGPAVRVDAFIDHAWVAKMTTAIRPNAVSIWNGLQPQPMTHARIENVARIGDRV